eukprot:5204519-Karenia_brevis.AAC.1
MKNDQCESGMTVEIDGVEYPARKTTGWMSNSREVAHELAKFQCRNRTTKWTGEYHEHGQLISGRAKQCSGYRPKLVAA